MTDYSIKIENIAFENPLLAASGTFGYGAEVAGLYDVGILGGIVTKTITRLERPGNKPPRIAETSAGMLNAIGLANVGIDRFITEKMPFLQDISSRIIVNIAGDSDSDFIYLAERLEDCEGIDGYELNLSCPNVAGGLDFSVDPNRAAVIVAEIKKRTKRLVIPKLTPNVTDITVIAQAVEDAGADAISMINTLVGMGVNIQTKQSVLANVTGGLSGPAIKPVALAMVYQTSKKITIPIIGIGGISTAIDVLEFLMCGAAAVQLGTINFVNPQAPLEIITDLKQYANENGITKISNITGSLLT